MTERPASMADRLSQVFATWEWDVARGEVRFSPRWEAMLGRPAAPRVGPLAELFAAVAEEDVAWVQATLEGQAEADHAGFQIEYRLRTAEGLRWMHCGGCAERGPDGRVARVIGLQTDIDARKRGEEALRVSEERYALAAKASSAALWDWDVKAGTLYVAPRWLALHGMPDEAGDRPRGVDAWFERIHPDDVSWVEAVLESGEGAEAAFEVEYRSRRDDGGWIWVQCRGIAMRGEDGALARVAGSLTDITERKAAEQQVLHDAFHDALTGLPSRALFLDRLRQALRHAGDGSGERCAVLVLDVDRLDMINDRLGHQQGDKLLQDVANRLAGAVGPGDTLARLSGDQFAVLADGIRTERTVPELVRRIQHALVRPVRLAGHDVFVTLSIGITTSAVGYDEPEAALRDAGVALARARQLGRGRHEVFDTAVHARVADTLELESHLRAAIETDDQIRPHYQPIVDLRTGRLAGFEALVRWRHPTRGELSPGVFMSLAEDTGLIAQIGLMMIDRAAVDAKRLAAARPDDPPYVGVNVSGQQILDRRFPDLVAAVLEDVGLDPRQLKIEVTETVLMSDLETAIAVLRDLKALGVRLAIDDFGTGYSSLSYLSRFPIDTLKIDMSFVRGMLTQPEDRQIVRIVADLGAALGLDVVAEGVERAEQAALLGTFGALQGQGWLYGRAASADDTEALVQNWTPRPA